MMRNKAEAGTLSECMPLGAVPSSNQSNKHGTKVPTPESMISNGAGVLTPLKNNTTEVPTPEGYKQTKVGVIPEEWEEYPLKDILHLSQESLKMEDEEEYELITVRRRFGGVDSRGIFRGKEILVKNQFYVRENDFVISKRQISHGACGLIPKELDGAIVSNEYNVFKVDSKLLDPFFLNYYVRMPKFSRTFYSYSDGVHIEKLLFKTQSWLKQKIPFPPLKEQQKIAQILTIWDNAIAKEEALIEAKGRLKKGLMQKLLSGEVRFSGFDEEWEEVRLGDLCNIKTGTSKSKFQSEDGDYLIVDMGSISRTGKLIPTKKTNHDKDILHKYDLIMPKDDIGGGQIIGRTAIIDKDNKYIMGDHIYLLKVIKDDPHFINYSINSFRVNKSFRRKATGTAQLGLNKKSVEKQNIFLPKSKQEQEKIAQVLTTADKEIELLKKELEALKEQKHGLMQRLLTGEVRVEV